MRTTIEIPRPEALKICPIQGDCEKAPKCELKGLHQYCNTFRERIGKTTAKDLEPLKD